jgi:hypothetical protein
MDAYVIKRRTTVWVSQPGEETVEGVFCLTIDSPELHRAETILDLLKSSRRMVPFVRAGDQRVVLLTRMNIDWVIAGSDVPAEHIFPPDHVVGFEEPVQVQFLAGRTIEGQLQIERLNESTRASDYLNGPGDFFPVVTRLGTLLANKSRVRETVLVESNERRAQGELPRQQTVRRAERP